MVKKEITLCGKQINIAYCYATEISFKILTDEDINDYMQEAYSVIQAERMPDIDKSVKLILSAITAYYESKEEEPPIGSKELLYESTPTEIGNALGVILAMRVEFYHVPKGEPSTKEESREEKNA